MTREYTQAFSQSVQQCALGDIEENDPGDVDDDTETFPMSAVQDPRDPQLGLQHRHGAGETRN